MNAFWIILTASLVSTCCALLGCFLVLRKMAMVGDAISHAVLPGIVVAFFLSGSLSSTEVLVGATVLGLVCTFLIEFLDKKLGVQADAAIGLVFTFLFAVGVIMISTMASGNLHLDQDCVLHGEIAYVPLDTWTTVSGTNLGPRPVWILGGMLLLIIGFIVAGYRGLFLTTFDPDYAVAIGVSTTFWHYLLMGAVSMTTVVSFESVGAILVVAFLVTPAATAYLLTDNLKMMFVLSILVGILASVGGYYLAVFLDGSIAGAITTVMGILFLLTFLFAPKYGYFFKNG